MSEPQAISGGSVLPFPTVCTEIEEDPAKMAPDTFAPRVKQTVPSQFVLELILARSPA
jgi:hypothetical protein